MGNSMAVYIILSRNNFLICSGIKVEKYLHNTASRYEYDDGQSCYWATRLLALGRNNDPHWFQSMADWSSREYGKIIGVTFDGKVEFEVAHADPGFYQSDEEFRNTPSSDLIKELLGSLRIFKLDYFDNLTWVIDQLNQHKNSNGFPDRITHLTEILPKQLKLR